MTQLGPVQVCLLSAADSLPGSHVVSVLSCGNAAEEVGSDHLVCSADDSWFESADVR